MSLLLLLLANLLDCQVCWEAVWRVLRDSLVHRMGEARALEGAEGNQEYLEGQESDP